MCTLQIYVYTHSPNRRRHLPFVLILSCFTHSGTSFLSQARFFTPYTLEYSHISVDVHNAQSKTCFRSEGPYDACRTSLEGPFGANIG